MSERLEAAMKAYLAARVTRGMDTSGRMRDALAAADAPILALIEDAETNRGGSSMYCKVTTHELREALGMKEAGNE